jgi:hypothetical protein
MNMTDEYSKALFIRKCIYQKQALNIVRWQDKIYDCEGLGTVSLISQKAKMNNDAVTLNAMTDFNKRRTGQI